MSGTKSKKQREKSKTRLWEQERRNRLNDYFKKLWESLPIYDASKPMSKPDILFQAASTIKELDEKLKNLLLSSDTEKSSEEKLKVSSDVIKKLQDRVKKLLLRNEQLTNLLSSTGIKIPSECGSVKKFKKSYKYANAISKEQQAKIVQNELEKENQIEKLKNGKVTKTKITRKKATTRSKKRVLKKQLLSAPKCVFVVTQPGFQNTPCIILAKPEKPTSQTITNSVLLKSPIISSQVKPSPLATPSPLAGTLLLTNGTVMPLIPTLRPLSLLPLNFTSPPTNQLIVVSSKNASSAVTTVSAASNMSTLPVSLLPKSTINSLPPLRPRSNITRTTQVNKVPIPALSSRFSKHSCLDKKSQRKKASAGKISTATSSHVETCVTSSEQKCSAENETVDKAVIGGATTTTSELMVPAVEEVQAVSDHSAAKPEAVDFLSSASLGSKTSDEAQVKENAITTTESMEFDNIVNQDQLLPASSSCVLDTHVSNPNLDKSDSRDLSKQFDLYSLTSDKCFETQTKPEKSSEKDNSLKDFEARTTSQNLTDLNISLPQTELSNDIFASFQVPPGCQNPESTSPTAAFLLAFPLVSSGVKVAEVMGDENSESQADAPNLLQIGTMDISKTTHSFTDNLTPNLLNFDNFSFFKDCTSGFYNNFNTNSGIMDSSKSNQQKSAKTSSGNEFKYPSAPAGYKVVEESKKDSSSCAKFPHYYRNQLESCVSQKESSGVRQNSDKVVNQNNFLDINSDIFSFRPSVSESYKQSSKISTSYPTYKSCNSLTTNSWSGKHYPPVYTSAASNTFYNSFAMDVDFNNLGTDYNSKTFNCSGDYQKEQKSNQNLVQSKPNQTKTQSKPINWMTAPSTSSTSYKADYFLPPLSKEPTFNTNMNACFDSSVCNQNDHHLQEFRKPADIPLVTYNSYQRLDVEDTNNFSWSPNKMPQFLDTNHAHSFVSSTLPTLVGDLALNVEQKKTRGKGVCESGQSSFLSVSQLVEQSQENRPAKVVSRRSSGNRPKVPANKSKVRLTNRAEKDVASSRSYTPHLFSDKRSVSTKNVRSIYSAEALIANESSHRVSACQNKSSIVPTFLNDNLPGTYYPPVEVSQDNGYMHTNQTYQSNAFGQNFTTTFQSNSTYSSNNFIPTCASSYLSTNNFMPNHNVDFLDNNLFNNAPKEVKTCNFSSTKNYKEDKSNINYNCKKSSSSNGKVKRTLNDNVLPSFDIHFFSMPGAINSPILPDDFHTTYLPPTTTLYSCKNPLYPSKATNEATLPSNLIPPLPAAITGNRPPAIQHPQMSPSVNSAGTSLTNFNLSTIFPEINKGPVQENFNTHNRSNKSYSNGPSIQIGSYPG